MQTKTPAPTKKTKLRPTSSRVMPIKGSCKLPPQWAKGMPVLLAYLDRYPCPINLLRRRCADWTIPSGRGVFHPTGHATGEPCAVRTWQPMAKRLPFQTDVFPAGVKPLPPRKKIKSAQRPERVDLNFLRAVVSSGRVKNIRPLPGPSRPI